MTVVIAIKKRLKKEILMCKWDLKNDSSFSHRFSDVGNGASLNLEDVEWSSNKTTSILIETNGMSTTLSC